MSSAPATGPSLSLIFDTLNAYQKTEALSAAIDLDLFTAIAEGNQTSSTIGARIGASERGTRILCDFLTVIGFLTKTGDQYALTHDSEVFLNRHSPAYMGNAAEFLVRSSKDHDTFANFSDTVRRGGASPDRDAVSHDNPIWVTFARAMGNLMSMPASLVARLLVGRIPDSAKTLDIAAGHGQYGIAIARQFPKSTVYALDWANVLAVAAENAAHAGVADRHFLIPGSAFDVDFGKDYDLVLVTNFLHHFDIPACETFLKKVHAALKPGGIALTVEFIPDENRVAPATDAMFSLTMLANTESGDAYTFPELDRMYRNAGFSRSEFHTLTPTPQRAVVSYK